MDEAIESNRLVKGTQEDPTSDKGRAVFASLFEEKPEGPSLMLFPVTLPARTHLTTHRHTAGVAACVTAGEIAFVFGADGVDRVELERGDYVWIREGVMHDEESPDGVAMVVAHLEPFETLED